MTGRGYGTTFSNYCSRYFFSGYFFRTHLPSNKYCLSKNFKSRWHCKKRECLNHIKEPKFPNIIIQKLNMKILIKVEKILKGSLDSIPSPSVKFKLCAGKFAWGVKKNIVGYCQQTFENKKFVEIIQQCFAILSQVNFPANNLNFHW